jgi:hypothetical protein
MEGGVRHDIARLHHDPRVMAVDANAIADAYLV